MFLFYLFYLKKRKVDTAENISFLGWGDIIFGDIVIKHCQEKKIVNIVGSIYNSEEKLQEVKIIFFFQHW